ncbi:hypothetical protein CAUPRSCDRAFT_11499 [Caulochytrium protostelioides]|uniref:Uncharacterized protein n=1 Tax=Caulochytrium protostelioides TaxID=1555241 RepID=A0A4P9WZK6_9FUNG|nr:hypothetical protein CAUPRSCDRAFT_11499 [Caulochytrium protostelioides]
MDRNGGAVTAAAAVAAVERGMAGAQQTGQPRGRGGRHARRAQHHVDQRSREDGRRGRGEAHVEGDGIVVEGGHHVAVAHDPRGEGLGDLGGVGGLLTPQQYGLCMVQRRQGRLIPAPVVRSASTGGIAGRTVRPLAVDVGHAVAASVSASVAGIAPSVHDGTAPSAA